MSRKQNDRQRACSGYAAHTSASLIFDIGRVLHVVEGKGKEDIRPFLETLARRAKKLRAVAMDMSSGLLRRGR